MEKTNKAEWIKFQYNLGDEKLIQLLIQNGSNMSATNNDGNIPLHLAAIWGREIKSCNRNDLKSFWILGEDQFVKQLIQHGSNMSAKNRDGNTALHLAASEGNKIE